MSVQIQNNTQKIFTQTPSATHQKRTDEHQVIINLVSCCTDSELERVEISWPEFCALLTAKPTIHGTLLMEDYQKATPETRKKEKDNAGWIPASFKDQGAGRNQDNVDELFFVVLDCDDGITVDEAVFKLNGYEAVIHTTYSHTNEKPKLRAVLPLNRPVKPNRIAALFDLMQSLFDNKLDRACLESSRLFYLPACPSDSAGDFQGIHLSGHLLDIDDAIVKKSTLKLMTSTTSPEPSESVSTVKLATVLGVPVGNRNTELTKQVGNWINKGFDVEKTLEKSLKWNETLPTPLSEFEIKRTVLSVFKTAERKTRLSEVELEKIITAMNRSYAFLHDSSRVVRLEDRSIQTKEMMRDRYSNAIVLDDAGDRARRVTHYQAWNESPNRREHIGFTFQPGQGLIVDNHVNMWTGWGTTPAAGDVKPWSDMLDYLFGVGTEGRQWIEKWIAYPLQYPGTKLSTAVVIWSSRQGVGKSLLGETVGRLYGNHAKTITATELHDKNNSWAEDALFVLGEENSGSDRRADSNRLKHLITGDMMFVHEKYQVAREAPNLLNFMFTSNHPDAFHLEIHDRRFFVWSINAQPKSADFYKDFVGWRDSPAGLAALMAHLLAVDLTGFDPFGHAPLTNAKIEMVEQSKTEIERWITDALTDDYIDNHLGAEIVSLNELVARFHNEVGNGKTNTTALGKALRRQCAYEQNRVSMGKDRLNVISLRRHEYWRDQDKTDWSAEYLKGRKASLGISLP